jgi:DNA topoisomerase-1
MPSKKPGAATLSRLVIVESPTKAKTISKFLDKSFSVEACMGHVRDLPKAKLGINVKEDFAPSYVVPPKAHDVISSLKKQAHAASNVILATDEDREGEAISWHLVQALELTPSSSKGKVVKLPRVERIAFHEITKTAVEEALKKPREIDMHLVNAQQARRVLDRLVGYELSPFLWRKIRYGLSAGRVQSVAVRLIVEREREIEAFTPQEYWSLEAVFRTEGKARVPGRLFAINGKTLGKFDIASEKDAKQMLKELDRARYSVSDIATKEISRQPAPPFTTSTLQQEAARKLGYSAKETMYHAQRLYERGNITYMRTDSVNLAASALANAREVITKRCGKAYALAAPRFYATKSKGAQEAHEAIRPTNLGLDAASIDAENKGQRSLYDLIWKRTLACQMQTARLEQTSVNMEANTAARHTFRATGQVVLFDGFMKVYTEGRDEKSDENGDEAGGILPPLQKEQPLTLENIEPLQHFTQPPPRYTDATLVKTLEAAGVGRPSTYAPTLTTIQERGYVEKIDKKYRPTEIGMLVNDLLVAHFPEIVDVNFTSHIEEELDKIAEGGMEWTVVCREFYTPFKTHLLAKEEEVEKHVQVSETPCPHCGKMMLMKFGRMGKFLACPEEGSKVTKPMPEEEAQIKELEEKTKDERCPLCGLKMKVKRGRFGFFLSCSEYPKCKGVSRIWDKTGFKCLNCATTEEAKAGDIVLKKSRGRGKPFFACTRYPDCAFVMNKRPETEEELKVALAAWKQKQELPLPEKTAKKKSKK